MDKNNKRLALVTGGTGGIGTAICRELVDQGFNVVAGYYSGGNHEKARQWQQDQAKDGYDIAIAYGDIVDYDSCKECMEGIQKELGTIDVLVNNAGITRDTTFKRMTPTQWIEVINTNLNSMFNVTRLVIDQMLEQNWGRIINISSINGEKGQFGQTNYSAAKAGIHGFTKALAQEVARKGVTVNTISPGYIATSMIMEVPEKVREGIRESIPVGRFGEASEIGRIVSFLADDRSGFITGTNISANGGQYMH